MPPVRFRDVTIDGTDHSISKLMRKGKLVLTHRQGAFGLSIVALDYINGGNYSYLYNLEGFDSQWNDNRHNNRLLFANLPPGNYSLNVRYRNNMTGELSPVGRLAIRVLPPPYASAWAWVVYGTAACVFVAFTGRYLERRRRERMHRRQALYDQHSTRAALRVAYPFVCQPDQRTFGAADAYQRFLPADPGVRGLRRLRAPAGGIHSSQCPEIERSDLFA